jgi:hypothetical protein
MSIFVISIMASKSRLAAAGSSVATRKEKAPVCATG